MKRDAAAAGGGVRRTRCLARVLAFATAMNLAACSLQETTSSIAPQTTVFDVTAQSLSAAPGESITMDLRATCPANEPIELIARVTGVDSAQWQVTGRRSSSEPRAPVFLSGISWACDRPGNSAASYHTGFFELTFTARVGAAPTVHPVTLRLGEGRDFETPGYTNADFNRQLQIKASPPLGMQALTVGTSGSGRVVSTPAGIDCPATCVATFSVGQTVTLAATPVVGANFLSWTGACAGTAPTTTVVLDAAKTCAAGFSQAPDTSTVPLTVAIEGQGTVTSVPAGISCPGACTTNIERSNPPRPVTLTPVPAAGQRFYAWSGDPDCGDGQLTMSAALSCTATFVAALAPSPDGSGWTVMGTPLVVDGAVDPSPSVASDGSNPVVAYVVASSGDVARLFVKRLEGASFVTLGSGALNAGSITAASEPSLVTTTHGQPFVAWIQGNGIQQNVFVARFNGTAWESVGPPGIPLNYVAGSTASRPALALDAENQPLVAWLENGVVKLKRFDGAAWVAAAGGEGPAGATGDQLRLSTDLDGVPVLAWRQPGGGGALLKVVRGLMFEPLGASINAPGTPMTFFDVNAEVGGATAVLSEAVTPVTVRRQRWDGSAWVFVAGPIVSNDPRPLESLVLSRGFQSEVVLSLANANDNSAVMSAPGLTSLFGTSYAQRLRNLSAVMVRADSPIVAATQSPTSGRYEARVWRFYP